MPDPNSIEEITQKEARAKAEAALLRAQADLIKAQGELAAANKSPDQTVITSTAEKERLDAQKGALEARKALHNMQKQADLEATQSAIGRVAGSNIEGSVTVKQDAGKGEATLLASLAVVSAADRIADSLANKLAGKTVVLTQGAEGLQFENYRQFLLQQGLLSRLFEKALKEAGRLEQEAKQLVAPGAALEAAAEAVPVVTATGVAIDAIAKLGSYFMSNYEIGGVAPTPDVEQLVSAVADRMIHGGVSVVLPDRRIPRPSNFADTIQQVADNVGGADQTALRLGDEARRTTALSQAEADAGKSARLQQAAKLYDQAAALLRNAIARADEFVTGLGIADAKGVLLITKLAQEKSVCDELTRENTLALVLDLRATVGGYYTKKNFWTFLGGMPFFAMGGAVVTYFLLDSDGRLVASGLVPIHSGYEGVDRVPGLVNRSLAASGRQQASTQEARTK